MIQKVKYQIGLNYEEKKSIELDFCRPYKTIIIAGENGTYKSTALNTIFEFIKNKGRDVWFGKRIHDVKIDFETSETDSKRPPINYNVIHIYDATINYVNNTADIENTTAKILCDLYNAKETGICTGASHFTCNVIDKFKKEFDKFFKEKNLSFSNAIESLQSPIKYDSKIKSNTMTMTEFNLPQIVYNKTDGSIVMKFIFSTEIPRNESETSYFENELVMQSIDMYRNFIKNMTTPQPIQSNLQCLFEKNNQKFDMKQLSDGEKKLVYLSTILLHEKNKHCASCQENNEQLVVIIDEPELSMHPKWQKRILRYYQDLLTDQQKKEQTAQLIVATHSPYIIESAMTGERKKDTLIITLKEEDGKIKPTRIFYDGNKWTTKLTTDDNNQNKDFLLPSTTSAEINRRVFDIFSKDYLFQLYSLLSDTIDKKKKEKIEKIEEKKEEIEEKKYYKEVSCNKCIQKYIEENIQTYIQRYIDKDKDTKDQEKYKQRVHNYYIRELTSETKKEPEKEPEKIIESLPTLLRNAYAHADFNADFNNKPRRDTVEEYKYKNSEGKEIVVDQDTQIKDACEILENIISDYNILSDDRIQELIEKCKNDNKKNDKNGTK